jgi:thioredoxin 2
MSADFILLRCKLCRTVNRVPADRLKEHPICGKCKAPLEYPEAPVHGTHDNFKEEVLEWPGIALVEFWAKWCGACRLISPVLDQLAAEEAGRLKVVKVDVDEEPLLSGHFHIKATPTLVLYRNGSPVNGISGSLNKSQLDEWIEESLKV